MRFLPAPCTNSASTIVSLINFGVLSGRALKPFYEHYLKFWAPSAEKIQAEMNVKEKAKSKFFFFFFLPVGFKIPPVTAHRVIEKEKKNREVLFSVARIYVYFQYGILRHVYVHNIIESLCLSHGMLYV